MNSEIAKKRISEVVRIDTVSSSQADFLATHVPLKKIQVMRKYDDVCTEEKALTEEEVYQQYILNPKNKHQFILVIGSSGAGKSHFIRWADARLEQSALEDEVVLFVRRSDNSLKGTIKQLLEKPEIASLPNKEIYERLVRAGANINDKKLKDMLYQNFIVEIMNDDENEILTRIEKKRFIALLSNATFRERLMEEGKAIDRIYAKVAENVSVDNRDVIALFDIRDFYVDNDLWDEMDHNADRNAIKMVAALKDDDELAEKLAEYMNRLVDKVIQTCAGLEPGDFEQVFYEIRKELRRQGKNLTLLIEDITAFSGVNIGLLNVLTNEATGMYEDDALCRISSIVGTTEVYYKTKFQDNHKDRVTQFILIPNDVFGDNSAELYEFVGRYVNTMSLSADVVEQWAKNGNLDSEYPVHEVVEGKTWDYVELSSGQCLCLYPFTKHAILNLYRCTLQPDYRTPRYLLRDIVEKTILDVLYNKEHFPEFKIMNVPMFKPIEHGQYLSNYVENEEYERLRKFICVWGEANVYQEERDGNTYLGGIRKEIFNELGFTLIDGIENNAGNLVRKPNTSDLKVKPEEQKKKEPETIIKPVQEVTQEEKDYQTGLELIHKWMEGMTMNIGATTGGVTLLTKARDAMNNYLYSAINWQSCNVSMDNVLKIKMQTKKKLIGFERQKRGLDDVYLELEASRETQQIMEFFLAYCTLGKQSWNFEGAPMMVYSIQKWTEKIKDKIVQAVNSFEDRKIDYSEYAIAAELYRLVLFGIYKGTTIEGMSSELILNSKNIKNVTENGHSRKWNELMNLIRQGDKDKLNKETIKQYFNLVQGSQKSNHFFFEQDDFAQTLKKVKKNKVEFTTEEMQLVDPVAPRKEVREYLKSIVERLELVCNDEMDKAIIDINKLNDYFDDAFDLEVDDIDELASKVSEFYNEVNNTKINIRYDSDLIDNIKNSANGIEAAIEKIGKAQNKNNGIEKLMIFSQDPLRKTGSFVSLVDHVKADIDTVQRAIEKRREKIGNGIGSQNKDSKYEVEKSLLQEMSIFLSDMEVRQ